MTTTGGWRGPEPESGPAPGVAFADPASRLIAYIVDVVVNAVVIIALVVGAVVAARISPMLAVVPFALVVLVGFLYFPYFWQSTGQTPGMRMAGIKVVRDEDGGPITWGPAILRLIGYWINQVAFYLGFIWIFIDKRKRGWHDLIAGTVVVKIG